MPAATTSSRAASTACGLTLTAARKLPSAPTTSTRTAAACAAIPSSEHRVCAWAPEWSRQAAALWPDASSARACTEPWTALTPFSPCAAAYSAATTRTSGLTATRTPASNRQSKHSVVHPDRTGTARELGCGLRTRTGPLAAAGDCSHCLASAPGGNRCGKLGNSQAGRLRQMPRPIAGALGPYRIIGS